MNKQNKKYDLIVVPALLLGPRWGMRLELRNRLKVAIKIYQENPGAHIVVLGRWSIWFDWLDVRPPITEAKIMKDYLIRHGVGRGDILMESHSKDTPGNVYYLKRLIRNKPQYKKMLVVCAKQREKRLRFLFSKFFESDYNINYLLIKDPRFAKNALASESKSLAEQKALLASVRRGHEEDFKHQFYKSAYYTRQASGMQRPAIFIK